MSGGGVVCQQLSSKLNEGICYDGASLVAGTAISGYTASTSDYCFGPTEVLSYPTKPSVLVLGDSIIYGNGDTGFSEPVGPTVFGWPQRVGYGRYAVTCHGFPGASLFHFLNYPERIPVLRRELAKTKYTHAVLGFGANDCLTLPSETIISSFTRMINVLAQCGIYNVKIPLILPRTTSTDSWATIENQTPATGFEPGGVRDVVNTWIAASGRAIDAISAVSIGSAWIPGFSSDGTHPTDAAAYTAIAGTAESLI